MTTKDRVLKHFKTGRTLTNMEAFDRFNTTSLAWDVWALRQEGHNIKTVMVKNIKSGKTYARYYLSRKGATS